MDQLYDNDLWLSRLLLQRSIAMAYLIAFLVALNQFRPLLGEKGLLPVSAFLRTSTIRSAPSIFHLGYSDGLFLAAAGLGAFLSALALLGVPEAAPLWMSMLIWLLLWALYLSIVNVGQIFYAFGWESLLLESGFLAVFLGPADTPPAVISIWLFRWLLFRLEFGAGLIKIRGDKCWRDLSCLDYHHETQPMPNPLSWYFHRLPRGAHRIEVAANHFVQLVVPFGLFAPQPVAAIAGLLIVLTQTWLIASGNYSWLNFLTLSLAFSSFDNAALARIFPVEAPATSPPAIGHAVFVVALAAVVALLSVKPVRNMLSPGQLMNYSFNRFHFVNTYGAFGTVTKRRYEVVIEGTTDNSAGEMTRWQEYEFKAKPGDPARRPPQIAPYHLRLDWLMWFVAMSPAYGGSWFRALLEKLLLGEPGTLRLLKRDPFGGAAPRFVRARLYLYRFSTWQERRQTGNWWVRTLAGEYFPAVSLETIGGSH